MTHLMEGVPRAQAAELFGTHRPARPVLHYGWLVEVEAIVAP